MMTGTSALKKCRGIYYAKYYGGGGGGGIRMTDWGKNEDLEGGNLKGEEKGKNCIK